MKRRSVTRLSAGFGAVITLLAAGPAAVSAAPLHPGPPPPAPLPTTCTPPVLSQMYEWAGDANWYAPLPGFSWDQFVPPGWTFSHGAGPAGGKVADGFNGGALNLPSGSVAVSPPMCVSNVLPTFRSEMENVKGSAGVTVSVSYYGAQGWGPAQSGGTLTSSGTTWTLPSPLYPTPSSVSGWQYARFTFTAAGAGSDYRLSNIYLSSGDAGSAFGDDPRMKY